jgi:serine/threonine protein kinase
MCLKDKKCGAWISLDSVGINAHGCLRDSDWLSSITVPNNQSIFNQGVYIDLPSEKLSCIRNVAHGKFGYIDLAKYDTKSKSQEVYVKRPIISGKSLIYEACIQKLVGDNLSNIGFPTGAPKLLSIFRLKDNSTCFAMEQIPNSLTLDKYLESLSKAQISNVIIDCLLQLSAMIWHLDTNIGINHRDLKPSNFLIVEHDKPIRRIINIEDDILEIESHCSLTFIDFGFSCLGSTETHICDISLSTVYSKSDPCPKEGRDMYLFLAFLYIDYYNKLPSKLISLFESWLQIPGTNLCSFMRKDKENSKKWLYFMAGNESIKKFNSCPSKIIKDLQSLI